MSDSIIAKSVLEESAKDGLRVPGYSYNSVQVDQNFTIDYIIKGVLDNGEVAVLFGDSGAMKSFVIMDLIFHASVGWDWHGYKANSEGCGVLIVLGEGQAGYKKRLAALKREYAGTEAPIWIVPEPVDLHGHADVLRSWIALAEQELGVAIKIILIDTFSLMLGDGEESSNSDVGIALSNARKAAEGRSIALVHHTGHGDKTRERGAYQIRGNADVRILVERDEGGKGKVITVKCLKNKDRELFQDINMGWKVVELGHDQDGDVVSSVVIVGTDLKPVKANASQTDADSAKALEVLKRISADHAATTGEWMKGCIDAGIITAATPPAQEKAFERMRKRLQADGLVEQGMSRGKWVPVAKTDTSEVF